MRYLLWLPLRVVGVVLLSIVTVFGLLRMLLRVLIAPTQGSPGLGCLMQLILFPIYAPVAIIYLTAFALHMRIVELDVKFGFAEPEELDRLYDKLQQWKQ